MEKETIENTIQATSRCVNFFVFILPHTLFGTVAITSFIDKQLPVLLFIAITGIVDSFVLFCFFLFSYSPLTSQ